MKHLTYLNMLIQNLIKHSLNTMTNQFLMNIWVFVRLPVPLVQQWLHQQHLLGQLQFHLCRLQLQ